MELNFWENKKTPEEEPENIWRNKDFVKILPELIKNTEENENKPRIILATYNRVGEGKLEGRINRPNFILDIINGATNAPLSEKEIKKFFEKISKNLEDQLMINNNKLTVILYGGTGENFNQAASVIDNLNSFTTPIERKPKFFLLTCSCELKEKIKNISSLIKNKRLDGLIYGEEDCGGFRELQEITDSLLKIDEEFIPTKKELVN